MRISNILDDYNGKTNAVQFAHSMLETSLTRLFEQITKEQGMSKCIRTDNGPILMRKKIILLVCRKRYKAPVCAIKSSEENGYIKRFIQTYKEFIACLFI